MVNAKQIDEISAAIWPFVSEALRGWLPQVQGAVLADLTAKWLAGHIIDGDPDATADFRFELIKAHVEAVHDLVKMYDAQ